MQNSAIRAAVKFRSKIKKSRISFESVATALKNRGCIIQFYELGKKDPMFFRHEVEELAQTVDAFTAKKDGTEIIFIQKGLTCEDKLYLLLHEAGHIILGHINTDVSVSNVRLQDMEADTFAYTVLTSPRLSRSGTAALPIWLLSMALCFTAGLFYRDGNNAGTEKQTAPYSYIESAVQFLPPVTDIETSEEPVQPVSHTAETAYIESSETVYVTSSGRKYHRETCGYVAGKKTTAILKSEAERTIEPCSVCKP